MGWENKEDNPEDGDRYRRKFLVVPCVLFLLLPVQSLGVLLWASSSSLGTLSRSEWKSGEHPAG